MSILDTIVENRRQDVEQRKQDVPVQQLERQCADMPPCRPFGKALVHTVQEGGPGIIAELKRASPSKGIIRDDFNPVELGVSLEACGANALSILTEERHFGGKLDYLAEVKDNVNIPLLRKDFIIDEYQIIEAKAYGADAILLIVSILSYDECVNFLKTAEKYGLDVLAEAYTEDELTKLLQSQAAIIGVNSRDLHTFEVDLEGTGNMLQRIPSDRIAVAESGVQTGEEIKFLFNRGAQAFLIGESLMRAPQPGDALRTLLSEIQ